MVLVLLSVPVAALAVAEVLVGGTVASVACVSR